MGSQASWWAPRAMAWILRSRLVFLKKKTGTAPRPVAARWLGVRLALGAPMAVQAAIAAVGAGPHHHARQLWNGRAGACAPELRLH